MVPQHLSKGRRNGSFPHTRGDGPAAIQTPMMSTKLFPTRVGMVPRNFRQWPMSDAFPHTRGDGPAKDWKCPFCEYFSPHAWGWSSKKSKIAPSAILFPTSVGMVLASTLPLRDLPTFPHTRGDVPLVCLVSNPRIHFSPQAWGWS